MRATMLGCAKLAAKSADQGQSHVMRHNPDLFCCLQVCAQFVACDQKKCSDRQKSRQISYGQPVKKKQSTHDVTHSAQSLTTFVPADGSPGP